MAGWTIFFGSDFMWSLYNGGISYIIMGTLFIGELIVRKIIQKNIPMAIPLTKIKAKSRKPSDVLCYEGAWLDGKYKTWRDFLEGTAKLRQLIQKNDSKRWFLYCEDCWHFLLAFTSLLQSKKEILLSANISPAYIEEICNSNFSDVVSPEHAIPFLSDHVFPENTEPKNFFNIPDVLENNDIETDAINTELPQINGEETSIVMFTSGSTGKPKAVKQRLTEFENDNLFVLSKWGEEIIDRRLCSTVSQHHIYGLLYSILLPFTAGLSFRSKRIEVPEELKKLSGEKNIVITVPAFLKRAIQIETNLKDLSAWIFCSGGVLDRDIAQKTYEIFGFWPLEVYGSTETSGIAWRQTEKGPEWTAFDNASISIGEDGCLVIRSPYIKDPMGFETKDLAEILEGNRFLLKGRSDSVVKIEEKRISLLEVEERILQSGLAESACVIALEDRRQYLAAAIVFNSRGKEKFDSLDKIIINKFWQEYLAQFIENQVIPKKWRYLEALPANSQGKIIMEDVKNLFTDGSAGHRLSPQIESGFLQEKVSKEKIVEQTENSITLEFSVPGTSPYFDGHFPDFSILPAVAQIEIIIRFASKYFGLDITVSEIKRVKFTNIIQPSAPLVLNLDKKENNISFKIQNPKGNIIYSKGIIAGFYELLAKENM